MNTKPMPASTMLLRKLANLDFEVLPRSVPRNRICQYRDKKTSAILADFARVRQHLRGAAKNPQLLEAYAQILIHDVRAAIQKNPEITNPPSLNFVLTGEIVRMDVARHELWVRFGASKKPSPGDLNVARIILAPNLHDRTWAIGDWLDITGQLQGATFDTLTGHGATLLVATEIRNFGPDDASA